MKVKRYAAELHDKPRQPGWRQSDPGSTPPFEIAAISPRAQIHATDQAIEKIRKDLGGDFDVEEIAGREPQG